jgi:hypothetical protein
MGGDQFSDPGPALGVLMFYVKRKHKIKSVVRCQKPEYMDPEPVFEENRSFELISCPTAKLRIQKDEKFWRIHRP